MNKKNYKFAFFISSLTGGGTVRVFTNLANNLIKKGAEIDMVVGKKEGPFLKKLDKRVNIINHNSSHKYKRLFIINLLLLIKYLKKERPNILISTGTHANIVASLAKLILGSSANVVVCREVSSLNNKIFINFLIKILFIKNNKIIAVSNGVKQDLLKNSFINSKKIKVIYNPIFKKSITIRANDKITHSFFNKNNKIIIAIGRLSKIKDFPTLIKAFKILSKSNENLRLIILGEGKERDNLEKLIKNYNIENKVDLPGFKDNPYAYLSKSDVFVLSSLSEGFGNVLVEAMACGTPVISTNCPGGPPEILDNGKYGKLVPVSDFKLLAKAIEESLKNPTNPEILIKRAKDFDVEKITNKYIGLIKKIY